MTIQIKKLEVDARLPQYALAGDAGMDIFSLENLELHPMERITCRTGIAMQIPNGYVGLIWDKSGIAVNGGIKVLGGVIDSGYRGEVKVGLINLSQEIYNIKKGDKIAQMLIQKVENSDIIEVVELDETERGASGFGSTGI
ncbi:MAG: dUTP diphosphatase [Candidatus Moranbacteria bacterium]|nr:dUTP diphosphatase [Candidatus Moranbacteria bacterium]